MTDDPSAPRARFRQLQRLLWAALIASVLVTFFALLEKGEFADHSEIDPDLLREPVQASTARDRFTFEYAGTTYEVEPVADYELWGLVVTHNDIGGIGDVYHDDTSVDTKDLGMIWGPNLRSNDFQEVKFTSGSWTCYVEWPRGVEFHLDAISNNHLVTSAPDLRQEVARVRVGDQVHFKGMLVNYRSMRHPEFWRRSSTTRDDTGNHACEVVFLDSLEILVRGTPGWYSLYALGRWLVVGLVAAKAAVFVLAIRAATAARAAAQAS